MSKKPTLKQKDFSKEYVENGGNATEAANNVYNVKNRRTASLIGCKNLQNETVKKEIDKLLEDHDISGDLLMEKLREGMEAKVVTNYRGKAQETDIPDLTERHKYIETGIRLGGYNPPLRTETMNLNLDVQLDNMEPGQFVELLKETIKGINDDKLNRNNNKGGEDKVPE